MKLHAVILLLLLTYCTTSFSRPNSQQNPCPGVKSKPGEYIMDVVEAGRACCKCNPGTYMKDICSFGNPASTQCEPCEFNPYDPRRQFYMDEGPHMNRKCEKAIEKCFQGFIRIQGSATVPARCELIEVVLHGEIGHG